MHPKNIPVLVTISRIVNSDWFWKHALNPGEIPPSEEEPLKLAQFGLASENLTQEHILERLAYVLTRFPTLRGASVRIRVLSIGGSFNNNVLTVYFAQKQPFQYRLQIGFDIHHGDHSVGLIDFWLLTSNWPTTMPIHMQTWYALVVPDVTLHEMHINLPASARPH